MNFYAGLLLYVFLDLILGIHSYGEHHHGWFLDQFTNMPNWIFCSCFVKSRNLSFPLKYPFLQKKKKKKELGLEWSIFLKIVFENSFRKYHFDVLLNLFLLRELCILCFLTKQGLSVISWHLTSLCSLFHYPMLENVFVNSILKIIGCFLLKINIVKAHIQYQYISHPFQN